jgi:hypothetical protein
MKTEAVLRCYRCGAPVILKHLSTAKSDPEGRVLHEFMRNVGKIALCPFHQAQRNYYASQGRSEEWQRGNL